MHRYRSTRKDSPFSRHFFNLKLKAMVHLSVIRILRLRSASEISIAGLVGFRFLLGLKTNLNCHPECPRSAASIEVRPPAAGGRRGRAGGGAYPRYGRPGDNHDGPRLPNLRVCEFTANPSTFPAGHFLASLPRLRGGTLRLLCRVSRAFILLVVHLLEEVDKPNGVDLSTTADSSGSLRGSTVILQPQTGMA